MASIAYQFETNFPAPHESSSLLDTPFNISSLSRGDEDEVLTALSAPSLTNVIMSGFVRDNGLVNDLNRGRFYACRNEQSELEGVALIGHSILFEAFSDNAIRAFATSHGVSSRLIYLWASTRRCRNSGATTQARNSRRAWFVPSSFFVVISRSMKVHQSTACVRQRKKISNTSFLHRRRWRSKRAESIR